MKIIARAEDGKEKGGKRDKQRVQDSHLHVGLLL